MINACSITLSEYVAAESNVGISWSEVMVMKTCRLASCRMRCFSARVASHAEEDFVSHSNVLVN